MADNNIVIVNGKKRNLSVVINDELQRYGSKVRENVSIASRDAMKRLVARTKDRAPYNEKSQRGWHYKDKITSSSAFSRLKQVYVWFVDAPDYRLTHLLTKGHKKRGGAEGKTRKSDYLTRSIKEVADEYEKTVEEAIQNAE